MSRSLGIMNLSSFGLWLGGGAQAIILDRAWPAVPFHITRAVAMLPWFTLFLLSFLNVPPRVRMGTLARLIIGVLLFHAGLTAWAELSLLLRPALTASWGIPVVRLLMYFALPALIPLRVGYNALARVVPPGWPDPPVQPTSLAGG